MGSGNRGQLRPHFSGRSPPFVVAALCVGIAILYTNLEHDLTQLLETNQLLAKEVDVTKQQLHLKEDEFVKSKTELESVSQELSSSKKDLEEKVAVNAKLESKLTDLQSELESTREEVNNIRATKEVLEKDKSDLVQQKDKLTSEKESLSQENNRLKQDLQRALSEKKTKSEVVEDKKEVNPQDDDKKVDADDSLNDREPLPVAAAVKFKTDESAPKIVSQDKKDVSDDDSPTNKGKEDKAVVGDEISAKIVGQSVSDDKLNMIVDAAEEAKRRDPSA